MRILWKIIFTIAEGKKTEEKLRKPYINRQSKPMITKNMSLFLKSRRPEYFTDYTALVEHGAHVQHSKASVFIDIMSLPYTK